MRNIIGLIITITIVLVLTSCSTPVSNTSSYIKILNKKVDSKNNYIVEAKNPYDKNAKSFYITIGNENLWNLIKEDEIYLSTYEYKDINQKVKLISIKYQSEGNSKS